MAAWANNATGFACAALVILTIIFILLIARMVVWPLSPAKFGTFPFAGRAQIITVPVANGVPGQMAVVSQPGLPSSQWHWATRPWVRAFFHCIQMLLVILLLSCMANNMWSTMDQNYPDVWFGFFSYKIEDGNNVSYADFCTGPNKVYPCRVLRAAGALVFICTICALVTSLALMRVVFGNACCANAWVEWVAPASTLQSLLLFAAMLIWALCAHISLNAYLSSMILGPSWSLCLVCLLLSFPLMSYFRNSVLHRPDGAPLVESPQQQQAGAVLVQGGAAGQRAQPVYAQGMGGEPVVYAQPIQGPNGQPMYAGQQGQPNYMGQQPGQQPVPYAQPAAYASPYGSHPYGQPYAQPYGQPQGAPPAYTGEGQLASGAYASQAYPYAQAVPVQVAPVGEGQPQNPYAHNPYAGQPHAQAQPAASQEGAGSTQEGSAWPDVNKQ